MKERRIFGCGNRFKKKRNHELRVERGEGVSYSGSTTSKKEGENYEKHNGPPTKGGGGTSASLSGPTF